MGRSAELFLEMRAAEVDDSDFQYQQYLYQNDFMASSDFVKTDECYLENLTIPQLESLLPAYYAHVDTYIRELIIKKRKEEDAKYNVDDNGN